MDLCRRSLHLEDRSPACSTNLALAGKQLVDRGLVSPTHRQVLTVVKNDLTASFFRSHFANAR
jgi:hypothetical protein